MDHQERRIRRLQIAKYAHEHGVTHTVQHFKVSKGRVHDCAREFQLRVAFDPVTAKNAEQRREIAEHALRFGVTEAARHYKIPADGIREVCGEYMVLLVPDLQRLQIIARLQSGESAISIAQSMQIKKIEVLNVEAVAKAAGIVFPK